MRPALFPVQIMGTTADNYRQPDISLLVFSSKGGPLTLWQRGNLRLVLDTLTNVIGR